MGIYAEYLDRKLSFPELAAERKKQLKRISSARNGRDVLVYAADFRKNNAPISIAYDDLLPLEDQLSNLDGDSLDLILESPGGSGEVAEDIVKLLHGKYQHVSVIVPGYAKSAATLIAMAAHEILMSPASGLGPIDAQIAWQGKVFSADALLEGMEKIKDEVTSSGVLNKAYIPILQNISPGELQSAENALSFAQVLVKYWLARYKFKDWDKHSSTGAPVTEEEKDARASEIAATLCDHKRWLVHGRSIKIADLRAMRLLITDYAEDPDLADAVRRYYTLLQMTFDGTNIYKVLETAESQIYRMVGQQVALPQQDLKVAQVEVACSRCKKKHRVQANLGETQPLEAGALPFPENDKLTCPSCAAEIDLSGARKQIEAQTKKPVVA